MWCCQFVNNPVSYIWFINFYLELHGHRSKYKTIHNRRTRLASVHKHSHYVTLEWVKTEKLYYKQSPDQIADVHQMKSNINMVICSYNWIIYSSHFHWYPKVYRKISTCWYFYNRSVYTVTPPSPNVSDLRSYFVPRSWCQLWCFLESEGHTSSKRGLLWLAVLFGHYFVHDITTEECCRWVMHTCGFLMISRGLSDP